MVAPLPSSYSQSVMQVERVDSVGGMDYFAYDDDDDDDDDNDDADENENSVPNHIQEMHDTFYQMCVENRLTDAMMFCLEHPDLDVGFEHDCCFYQVCRHGHLEFAQWIYFIGDGVLTLNQPTYFEDLIESVATYGHLHIMEWFHQLGLIDETTSLVSAYYRAALGGFENVANWILSR